MHFLPFKTIITLMLRVDHAQLLDVLMSLPVSQPILPRTVYFETSRPTNHAICSFIDSSGYVSGPFRRCLFIDYNGHDARKPVFGGLRTTQAQTSLRIRAV